MVKYTFFISAIDPDNNDVYYFIDWGDNTSNYWIGPFESGKEISVSHRWLKQGTFKIRIKAKNTMGAVSDWSEFTVKMLRSKAIINSGFLRFLERYPQLNKLLSLLLE